MLGFMEKSCYFVLCNQYIVFFLYTDIWLVFQHVHCLADFKVPVIRVSCWLQPTVTYRLFLKIICHGHVKSKNVFLLLPLHLFLEVDGQILATISLVTWLGFVILMTELLREGPKYPLPWKQGSHLSSQWHTPIDLKAVMRSRPQCW